MGAKFSQDAGAAGALAVAAWSIRGAGVACVATTLIAAVIRLVRCWRGRLEDDPVMRRVGMQRRTASIVLIVVLAAGYQGVLAYYSREKSVVAGGESRNSYAQQLIHGLTDGGTLSLARGKDYGGIAVNLGKLVLGHFDDYAASFVPWPRENPGHAFSGHYREDFWFFRIAGVAVAPGAVAAGFGGRADAVFVAVYSVVWGVVPGVAVSV